MPYPGSKVGSMTARGSLRRVWLSGQVLKARHTLEPNANMPGETGSYARSCRRQRWADQVIQFGTQCCIHRVRGCQADQHDAVRLQARKACTAANSLPGRWCRHPQHDRATEQQHGLTPGTFGRFRRALVDSSMSSGALSRWAISAAMGMASIGNATTRAPAGPAPPPHEPDA